MNKRIQLEAIARDIENCSICKTDKSGKAVPGEGNEDANIVFVGEAPGRNEAKTGRPFIGRSGKLLRQLIVQVGLEENQVFITSPVKYLPDYITPTPKDIIHGKIHLDKQLEIIDPKIIVLLGSTAIQALLQKKLPVLKHHGEVVKDNDRTYFLTIHPSAAIRFQKFRKIINEDFIKLKELMQKYV